MNLRFVFRQLGFLLIVQSIALAVAALWSMYDYFQGVANELAAMQALALSLSVGAVLGLVCFWIGRGTGRAYLGRREALSLVGLSWLIGAAVSGLPYWVWALRRSIDPAGGGAHPFESFASCYFEAMSGLTTTGATVLTAITEVPRGLLLWRALTHWLGGLGIIVLFVAVLPNLGVGGKKLFAVESPGPKAQGVRPRIGDTARVLWFIYLGMTIAETLLLRWCGMSWFDAVCHTFATLATGGFSTYDASVGHFQSLSINAVIIVFMILAGTNFGLFYQLLRGQFKQVYRDPELRLYLAIIFVASALIAGYVAYQPLALTVEADQPRKASAPEAMEHAVFQVVSIQTTTGFGTADFDQWAFVPRFVLVGLMFIGASAGSTGGGIKVIRILVAFKVIIAEIERVFRPNVVRTVKVGTRPVPVEMRLSVLVYFVGIIMLWLLGSVLLMLLEEGNTHLAAQGQQIEFTTAATASAATLNNIGPGLSLVGPVRNYTWFSDSSKIVMSLLMVLGRLEVYAVLVLFMPRFWKMD